MGVTPCLQESYTQIPDLQGFTIIPRQRPARQRGVRWARGRESKMRSSCQSWRRTSQSWAHHRAHHRYRNGAQDVPHGQPSLHT